MSIFLNFKNMYYLTKRFIFTAKTLTKLSSGCKMAEVDYDQCFAVAVNLTKKGGNLIRENIQKSKSVEIKSCEVDLVTETDTQVERLIITGLKEKFPGHRFIGEEGTEGSESRELGDDPTWIIDPVDGTMNFVHSFPCVCISIALWVSKAPKIGIIYNPVLDYFYTAREGMGAFLNEKPIHVSGQKDLSKSLIIMEMGTSRDSDKSKVILENVHKLMPAVHGIRQLGSCAMNMAMVAGGSVDAYFEFGIHAWDIAAGALIVKEAGGTVMDPAGGPMDVMSRRVLVAGNKILAESLSKSITQFYPPRD